MGILTDFRMMRLYGKLDRDPHNKETINQLIKLGAVRDLVESLDDKLRRGESLSFTINRLKQLGKVEAAAELFFRNLATNLYLISRLRDSEAEKQYRETIVQALMEIGQPALNHASDMIQKPSEQLSKAFKEETDTILLKTANLLSRELENKEITTKLRDLIQKASLEYNKDKDAYNETITEIRKLGEYLCSNGGNDRMVKIALQVKTIGGSSRSLELYWEGLCGWRY